MLLRLLQWLVAQEWLMRLLGPWIGPFNPFTPEFRRDPYVGWAKQRENDPIWFNRFLDAWMITEYEYGVAVLRDAERFSTDRRDTAIFRYAARLTRDKPELAAMIERSLLVLHGAEHRKMRGLVSAAFTPRRVEALRPRVEAVVDELLAKLEAKNKENGHVRFMEDFALAMPINVIMELLGLPVDDRALVHGYSDDLVLILDPFMAKGGAKSMQRAVTGLNAYLRPHLEARRKEPRDDLLSALLAAEIDGEKISESDLLVMISLILVAGHETMTSLLGNTMVALLKNPGERTRLRDDPSLITSAIEEFLRYDGPIQLTDRAATVDCEIAGRRIKKGQIVGVSLAACNRDPKRFPDPDRLDLSRTDNQHLALSHGQHFCLGAQLARLEAEVAINKLLARFPYLTGPDEPEGWRRSAVIRRPTELILELEPS